MSQNKKIKPFIAIVITLLFSLLLLLNRGRMDWRELFVVAVAAFFGCRILVSYLINEEIDISAEGGRIPAGEKSSFLRIMVAVCGVGYLLIALAVILNIIPVT